jgi:SOS-response transcriptional repressor LexA
MDVETLKRLMAENGESQSGLARMLDITRDKFHKVIKGKRRLTVEEADKLSRYFGLVPEPEEPRRIPVIGLVAAGAWREAVEEPRGWMPSPDKALSQYAFAVIVEGDSMNKIAAQGEVIIVDPADLSLIDGKFYVVRNEDGETTFKQFRHDPPRLEPCSSNKAHQTIYPGRDSFTIVGRARKKVSDL